MSSSVNLDEDMDDISTANKQNTKDEKMADGALEEVNSDEEALVLPPEVWASVMECKLLIYCCVLLMMYIPYIILTLSNYGILYIITSLMLVWIE